MKTRRLWLLCLVVGVTLGGLLYHALLDPEPSYDGKSLSRWLDDLYSEKKADGFEAAKALGKIGPKAVPGLIEALHFKESRLRQPIISFKEKLPAAIRDWLPTPRPSNWCRSMAADGLGEVGPGAHAAIPALMDALTQSHYQDGPCAFALCRITPVSGKTVLAVSKLLESDDWRYRLGIAYCLGALGPAAKPAVPSLIAALDHGSADLRGAAGPALWKIGETNIALAAHIHILKTDESYYRRGSASFLGNLGTQAKLAVPTLLELLNDEEADVRQAAREAVRKIDPQAAAGIHDKFVGDAF